MGQLDKGVCVVADDDPVVLEDLCKCLQGSHEFRAVKAFTRINEAIAYIQTHPVALFISDIEFPDGQLGFNHLASIPYVPVILMSVHARYMLENLTDIVANKNLAGYVPKPITENRCHEIIQRYKAIKEEGLGLSAVKEMAKARTIELCRFDTVRPRSFEVRYSEIAMIEVSRQPRGLRFYLNNNSYKYYLVSAQLRSCFEELNRYCPNLFCLIPRQGIVNLWNMALSGGKMVSVRSDNVKYTMDVPKPFLPVMRKITDVWSR